MLALGVCFPQLFRAMAFDVRRFAASRSRLNYYWKIGSFPRTNSMKYLVNWFPLNSHVRFEQNQTLPFCSWAQQQQSCACASHNQTFQYCAVITFICACHDSHGCVVYMCQSWLSCKMEEAWKEQVEQFSLVTGADSVSAREVLEASGWNVDTAIDFYFATSEWMHTNTCGCMCMHIWICIHLSNFCVCTMILKQTAQS